MSNVLDKGRGPSALSFDVIRRPKTPPFQDTELGESQVVLGLASAGGLGLTESIGSGRFRFRAAWSRGQHRGPQKQSQEVNASFSTESQRLQGQAPKPTVRVASPEPEAGGLGPVRAVQASPCIPESLCQSRRRHRCLLHLLMMRRRSAQHGNESLRPSVRRISLFFILRRQIVQQWSGPAVVASLRHPRTAMGSPTSSRR